MLRRVGLLEKIVMNFKFAVIGGGAWGTAIANLLARLNNSTVIIWAKEKEVVNEKFLLKNFINCIINSSTFNFLRTLHCNESVR